MLTFARTLIVSAPMILSGYGLNAAANDYEIWQSQTDSIDIQTIQQDDILVSLTAGPAVHRYANENSRHAYVEIFRSGHKIYNYKSANSSMTPRFRISFQSLLENNETPEIVLIGHTGGAHCCSELTVLFQDANESWDSLALESIDGDGYRFEDVNGDGTQELLTSDARFLRAYSSYACSYKPWRITGLKSGKPVDLTGHPDMKSIHRDYLERIENTDAKERCSSGFWPAYIAANAYLGQGPAAWEEMLDAYDPDAYSYRDRVICTDETLSFPKCPEQLKASLTYPESLEKDFRKMEIWREVLGHAPKETQK